MYGIVLILVLIIVGGLIAFIGDRLGSKVGKRKMTLFGLRPRHTSIIVTIVTGIAITTMTLGILAIASENVRTALFGMEKLQQRMQITQKDLNQADSALSDAKDKQQQMQTSLEKTKNALDTAKEETQQMKLYQSKLLSDNSLLENQNNDLIGQNAALNENNSSLLVYNSELKDNNSELKNNNSILQQKNANLTKQNGDLSNKRIIYQAGELVFGGVVQATTDRQTAQNSLSRLITMANTRIAGLAGSDDSEQAGLWLYPEKYESAINQICSENKDMVVRFIAASNLVQDEPVRTNIELYPDRIVYESGALITSSEFTVGASQGEAQHILLSFLHNINTIASAKGVLPDPLRGSIGVISMDQLYSVTEAIAQVKGRLRLSAYSDGNTDILGPLRLILKVDDVSGDDN